MPLIPCLNVTLFGSYEPQSTGNQNDHAVSVVLRDRPELLDIFGKIIGGGGVPICSNFAAF
jgi:hypothetical protein